MKILIDTNILLRLSAKDHPMNRAARFALRWMNANNHEGTIVPRCSMNTGWSPRVR